MVALQCCREVLECKAHRRHALHIGNNEVFLGIAAKGVDPGQPLRALELGGDDPVLDGTQVGCLVGVVDEMIALGRDLAAVALQPRLSVAVANLIQLTVFDGPHEDIAEPGRDRSHFGVHTLGKVFLCGPQPLRHLLTGKVDIRLLGKDGRDLSEAVAAERTGIFEAGDAGERGFDRERDLLLDLVGRKRGCDDVDLDLVVGDVGNGIDLSLITILCFRRSYSF